MTSDLRHRFLGVVVLVALLAAVATMVVPSDATAQTFPSIGSPQTFAVSADDLVVIAGSQGLAIDAPDGTRLAVIESLKGYQSIDIRDGDAYVGDFLSPEVVVVDLATRQIETTIDLGVGLRNGQSLAAFPDSIWFLTSGSQLHRYDRATGVSSRISTVTTASSSLHRFPGDDSRVLLTEAVFGGGVFSRVQTSPPYAVATVGAVLENHDLAPTDHGTFWATNLSAAEEIDANWMLRFGVVIPTGGDTVATEIDWSPLAGGTVAWATSDVVYIAPVGAAEPSIVYETRCNLDDMTLSDTAPVLHTGMGTCRLGLQPQLTRLSSTGVVADQPSVLTITGNGFGGDVGVAIDGSPVPVATNTPTELRFEPPTTLAPGTHTLAVTNAWGTTSRTITVHPNLGAELRGDVLRGAAGLPGAQVTISGPAIGAPLVATTDTDGRYEFSGLPLGDYRLAVIDPQGVQSPQVITGIALQANEHTELDVQLVEPGAGAGETARAPLPAGTLRSSVRDPAGRAVVLVGDEVVVAEPSGAIVGRMRDLPGIQGLVFDGGSAYGTLPTGEIVRIDLGQLLVDARWGVGASSGPVVAGGVLWFAAPTTQGASTRDLRSLDPTTGNVTTYDTSSGTFSLAPVFGDPDLLVRYGSAVGGTQVIDVSSGSPEVERSSTTVLSGRAFDAEHDRIFASDGAESRFSTFAPTGVTYPVADGATTAPTVAGSHGGLLVAGRSVMRIGDPVRSHELHTTALDRPALLDAAGEVALVVTGSSLVTVSLTPRVAVPAAAVSAGPGVIRVTGYGLGAATAARIDGAPVSVVGRSAGWVDLWVTSLTAGDHAVDVTTPWGTTDPVTVTAAYLAPPVASGVAPSQIVSAGGTVTITGSGFTGATQVKAGGSLIARSFTVVDDRTIVATFGSSFPSAMPITVTTPRGTSSPSTGPTLRWVAPQPVITEVTPNVASPLSPAVVTIRGTGFLYASAIDVGGMPATTVGSVTDTEATVRLPLGTPGTVHVRVTTPGGTSATGPASAFTWDGARPHVAFLSETSGPLTGGRLVVIRGAALTGVTEVWFGEVRAERTVVVDDGTVVVVTPPGGAAGTVMVRAVSGAGTSAPTMTSRYTFTALGTGTISGVVRSSSGPLAQMAVVLSGPRDFGVLTYALTDDDGRFQIPDVGSGEYRILTLDPRILFGAPDHLIGEFYDDGGSTLDDFAASTPVVVSAGATTVLDPIVLRHNTPASVSGVVRDAAGHGLGGLEVIVSPAGELDVSTSVLTQADGSFAVGGLAPGAYRVVTIDPAELRGDEQHYVAEVYDDAGGLDAFSSSTVVDVGVGASVTLSPIVLDHSAPGAVTGVVHGPGGVPLAGPRPPERDAGGRGGGRDDDAADRRARAAHPVAETVAPPGRARRSASAAIPSRTPGNTKRWNGATEYQ